MPLILRSVKIILIVFTLVFLLPLGLHALTWQREDWSRPWRGADWSSAGLLPAATDHPGAMVRIYSARVGRWRGIFATHSWIVVKDAGPSGYERYDKVGWGAPIRRNGYPPDGRWYGNEPELVFAADGAEAEKLIPRIREAVRAYAFARPGDYHVWPGPNSNSFIASVLAAIPETGATLPPTAIGKDFPVDGRWIGPAPSRTGLRLTLGGYAGLTLAWVEGIEVNILGAVAGLDLRHPALKVPGFGRLGL
ncbi:DUF3750 domain-containing protein [Ancylobacter sp. 6x-1]|uniref:DUF3750 domain-containing protein n=1 Tax=Ancylobacter crimeensis TaxID=2579147 RepID=A0ABT0DA50_9HYPH|nr:DUF3750 domain-containing protein [Ancylobacter crimeensis]MCK0196826.1 DUF3750 domain-containing protein [Ancylobacter crimeensis]